MGVVVFGVRRVHPLASGYQPRKSIRDSLSDNRLDIRHGLLFRHLLVADVLADHLRWFPVASRVFSTAFRMPDGGAISRVIRLGIIGPFKTVRNFCDAVGAVYLDRDRIPAVLGYRQQLERARLLAGFFDMGVGLREHRGYLSCRDGVIALANRDRFCTHSK